jgi:hypothetical protein
MRVIIGARETHIPSTPWSDVALCGESGEPDDVSVVTVTCMVCFRVAQQRMGRMDYGGPTPETA